MRLVLIFILLLGISAAAQTEEEALKALDRGDWKTYERFAQKARGLEGRLARARLHLTLGRTNRALKELHGDEIEIRVTRLEALYQARRYTEALALLRELERDRSGLEAPYDFQFYVYRGQVERRAQNRELAIKNFRHALRIAQTPEQKCRALDKMTDFHRDLEEFEKANETLLRASSLMSEVQSVWVVAAHLETAADLEYLEGRRASAVSMYRACQELYWAHDNRILLANSINDSSVFADFTGNATQSYNLNSRALKLYLEEGLDWKALERLRDCKNLYFQLGGERELVKLEKLHQDVISHFPAGPSQAQAKLIYAEFLLNVDGDKEKALKLAKSADKSADPVVETLAHQLLGSLYRDKGLHDLARDELEKALKSTPGQLMKRDRNWRISLGPIYLLLADLELSRHNFPEALQFARRGIKSQIGKDWRYWRITSRYKSLLIAVEAHDEENAVLEMRAALREIEELPSPLARAASFTNILAALLLNQSVGDDVIEPAQFLLGDYSVTAERVIERTFSDPQLVSRFLTYYDQWQQDAALRKETSLEPHAAVYKGLFLEALGRLDESKISLQLGFKKASEYKVKAAQMVSQVLLARISLREGKPDEAADYMTRAATVAESLNPLAGRFYLLTSGAIQRDVNRLEEYLATFTRAIELNPKATGPGYFGRALTYEKMGRATEAMADIDKALEELSSAGRAVSLARLEGIKARLLVRQGSLEEALPHFQRAHQDMMKKGASESLDEIANDYADCLSSLSREEEALQILTKTLDQLIEWHALNPVTQERLIERTVQLALKLDEKTTALKYLQLSHSAEFLQSVDIGRLRSDDPENQKLIRELGQLKKRMESLGKQAGSEGAGRMLASTRQQFFTTLNKLRANEPDFESLVQLSGSQLSSIQQLLSPDSIILEYFPAKNKLFIFAVTSQNFTLHEVVISRADLNKIVDAHLKYLKNPFGRDKSAAEASKKLHKLLLGSLGPSLEGMTNLRIVPSGPLWKVSFSCLVQSDNSPVIDDFEVSYLTSSDLARIRRTDERPPTAPKQPFLVGGAAELEGADAELKAIARKFPTSRLMTATQSSLSNFLKGVPGSDLIHIASHSRVSTKSGESYVELQNERLSLEQIYGLELEPNSLVVLSSCLSAVGVQAPAKEVTSLASAFSVAGASTVIASRWEVDDTTTAEFFGYFYQALLDGRRRGQAFREAELKMSKLHPHPYYWAGFSLFGDPD